MPRRVSLPAADEYLPGHGDPGYDVRHYDLDLSYSTDIVGKFCSSGAWVDLTPYINRDKVDLNQLNATTRQYTEFGGKRCAMPFLADAYGMYYNKDMFAKAGIAGPPKTLDELTEDAKKLTVKKSKGLSPRAKMLGLRS